MTMEVSDEQLLDNAGIRITAVRLLLLHTIRQGFNDPFSLADLEELLPTVDRSTLFRNLHSMARAGLLHTVDDGSGVQKYCVCHCDDQNCHSGHVHITCTRCHRTFCLTNVSIPSVPLPADFKAAEHEYIVKGLCNSCQTLSSLHQ